MADHEGVLRAHGYHRLGVKKVIDETRDTRTFVLDVPDELRATFAYRPGQFSTFRVSVGGKQYVRSYSFSTTHTTDADPAVTVKRVEGGAVSNWFNDRVAAGDSLEVTRPAGVFCPRDSDGPVVAYCGGSGITPVLSIAKHLLATTDRRIDLVYANRTRDSVIFDEVLAQLAQQHPDRLQVRHHFDCDDGFLTPDDITAVSGADYYICGPGPFMDLVESALLAHGVRPDDILIERFNVDETPAPPPPAASGPTGTVTVILKGGTTEVPYRAGDTVLETARRGGLAPPFSCEAGNCATCMAFVKEGTVRMRANNALTPEEVEEGWVLTCQSLPTSPTVTVEYESV